MQAGGSVYLWGRRKRIGFKKSTNHFTYEANLSVLGPPQAG
jgi:hypothetical protein